ncbi:GvpL/GvpF family gas vesicle protein [Neobacillus niacini]|uniref:GvpL/GvpF family gas vesicle protein n=1 Tax=Neobacillus niacini TaxID=86668 RepID=UPI00398301ED
MAHTSVETYFLYLYGVIPREELENKEIPSFCGIDQKDTKVISVNELAALITLVNPQNFSQENIDQQLKDPEWLKEKAYHHHECISVMHKYFTILPMSFCTIFQKEEKLRSLLNEQYESILEKLNKLKNKQEMNLKIYCDDDQAYSYVVNHNPAVQEFRETIASMPKGKQFIMKKKLKQVITSQVEQEQSGWWYQIERVLQLLIVESRLRKNWGREITERSDDMIVNCDFLIDKRNIEPFLNKILELEQDFAKLGCSFEVSGPWPPYHFSKEN